MNKASDLEDTSVNDRYVVGMHAVPPPMTGNYMHFGPDVEIDYSKFTYGPKQTSVDESDSKPSEYAFCDSDSSLETTTSMPEPVENAPKDKGIIDSGCSRHMTVNKAHLADYQEFKGDFVAFGGSNGRIIGKEKIKAGSFNLKNIYPSGDSACLFAKASIDKSNKWHRKLGHVNFKNLNKLVKGNLVRGIKREYSNARTPQQNEVVERKNKTLIEAARTIAGIQANDDQSANLEEIDLHEEHFVLPIWPAYSTNVKSSGDKIRKNTDFKTCEKPVRQVEQIFLEELEKLKRQEKEAHDTAKSLRKEATYDIQNANTSSTNLLNTISTLLSTAGPSRAFNDGKPSYPDNPLMPYLEDIYASPSEGIFTDSSYDDEDLPFGKKAIRTKWVYRNKKDEMGVVVRNNSRLVTQGHREEEGIDYDESAFLYGTIDEEVYVSQHPGFVEPKFSNKVYKVVKALYGLHQALRAWYATLSTFLEKSGYRRGAIDKTLLIKQDKKDIMLVYVYMDDIIFCFTKKSWCDEFEELMKNSVKTASTPIQTQKPLVKDKEAADVDVYLYRSMIGSLMYLIASRPDIMFAVFACSRFQTIVATSTTKAEYIAAAHCCGQVLWIQNQLLDYGFNIMNTKIYIDNKSTICIVKNPVFHSKTKHIEIRHHFIRDAYEKKLIQFTISNPHQELTSPEATGFCKELASPKQMTLGKDESNLFMAGSLPKTKWHFITAVSYKLMLFSLTKDADVQLMLLEYADGFECLPNEEIFAELARMGYEKPPPNAKRTTWNEFSCSMVSAIICLATVEDLTSHNTKYTSPALTQKVFANMKRVSKGFSGVETFLFASMLVQPQPQAAEEEDDVEVPAAPTLPSPTNAPSPPQQDLISTPPQAQSATPSPPQEQPTNTCDMDTELQGRKDDVSVAIKDVNATESTVFDDKEVTMTMAQTLIKMKAEKAKLLDEQMAKRLHDEEVKQAASREKQEKDDLERAKVQQQQYEDKHENIDWNIVTQQIQEKHLDNIKKYQSLKRKPISIAQARKNMIIYLKNMVGYKMEHFRDEEPTKKGVSEETLVQESFKKLKAVEVSSSESTQDIPTNDPKEMSKEDVQNMLEIVLVSEFKVEALQVKYSLIDLEIHSEGSRSYWKIIRVGGITEAYQSFEDMLKGFDREDLDALWRLVKEKFSSAVPNVDKEKALWVELKRLFKLDADDVLWKL
uniref:Retrotransposon protein, putative, unclassified n=1 Tax=Tanacetum cinerariifolium TaxID=118510 RepID=A0A6L2P663_TANCI|nr:retrotransposon protein, putative, unclassified [Tanacetum cinerariifolium]